MELVVDNLKFGYTRNDLILDGISCQFKTGGFYAIIGPNGSGKSTFIRILNGLLKPDGGTVWVNTRNIEHYSSKELAKVIGYVPQTTSGQGNATVYDTVMLGRKPHLNWSPGARDRKKVETVMQEFSIEHFALRFTNELSGGELQRVHIARALVQEPRILVLDEPTSSLDLKHQMEVMEILKNISDAGITVIVAIHDLNLSLRYAGHFLLLKRGKLISSGDKKVITERNLTNLYDVSIKKIYDGNQVYILPA